MLGQLFPLGVEEAAAVLVLRNPLAGKGAVLDVVENRLHIGLGLLVGQDSGAGDVLAELGGVGDGVVHGSHAALVDEVDDELHLMDALEVGVLGLVTGLHQGLKAAAHQIHNTAAENCLLAEQVGLGLIVHGGLHDAGAGAADTGDVGQGNVIGLAGGILLHGNQAGHALACHILGTNRVAGALGRSHEHVHVGGRHDLLIADIEAMGKGNGLALGQIGGDILLIHIGLGLVVDQNHDDIGSLGGLGDGHDREAVLFRHGPGLAALAQANNDVAAAVTQIQCMGMALGTVTDDGDLLAVQLAQIAVLLIIHFCHNRTLLFLW